MSGRMLLEGNPPPPVHHCDLPGVFPSLYPRSICLPSEEGKKFEGALWECDCGQAWHCRNFTWYSVTQRRARKILKRAGL